MSNLPHWVIKLIDVICWLVLYLLDVFRGQKGQSSLRELLQPLVEGVLNDKNLSINTNPLEVYKAWINQMESETGQAR